MKAKNKSWERKLIDSFKEVKSKDIKADSDNNFNCRSKTKADVQYTDLKGIDWFIEAKSFNSPDKHNGFHKIFGELLKMTKFAEKFENAHFGILIDDENFLQNHLESCSKGKLHAFGKIFDDKITVFIFSNGKLKEQSWESFIQKINH